MKEGCVFSYTYSLHRQNQTNNMNTIIMKRISALFLAAFIVLFSSCEKEPFINFGFDSKVDKNSNGLVIAHISDNDERIHLTGLVSLLEGEVMITLTNPIDEAVYSNTITAPIELEINERFEPKKGYWKLKYKSNNGIGTIDLHLYK